MNIQNLSSAFSDISFTLICIIHRRCVHARDKSLLSPSLLILRLTSEHKIPEKRELIDDNDRHLHT